MATNSTNHGPDKKLALAERRARVLELRRAGYSAYAIAQELGVSKSTVINDRHALAAMAIADNRRDAAEWVQEQLDELDVLWLALYPHRADHRVVQAMLKILERRAKLLGLDAAQRTDITSNGQTVGTIDVEAVLRSLELPDDR